MNEVKYNKLYFYILSIIAITLCYPKINAINNISIIVLGIIWIAEGKWREKKLRLIQSPIILLVVSFFLLHVIGLLYSHNITKGLQTLVDYIPLLLFPLVLGSISCLKKGDIYSIVSLFIASCFVATFICLLTAVKISLWDNLQTDDHWFYDLFTRPIELNSIYFSFFLGFCILCLGAYLFENVGKLSLLKRTGLFLLIIYFLGVMLLLTSRTTLIATLLLGAINCLLYLIKTEGRNVKALGSLMIAPILVVILISQSSFLTQRFSDIKNLNTSAVTENLRSRQKLNLPWSSSSAIRVAIWESSLSVIENNFFTGVGIGDTQEELVKMYYKNNYVFENGYQGHNAHNQFLQTMMTSGIVGVLLLLGIFMVGFFLAWRQKNYFYMTFILYVFLNCLTEALLQRQKGIVFFGFMSNLLFFYFFTKQEVKTKSKMAVYS
ncbi:O-antigen ligase family protein [Cytophagaceae bacterium YF14B1]|uniref:O-antigen ligase family protein n=1 Tax=Xanthocytophaga flava TaxID=3048013 RepID=A0AAE3QN79_9BACT|nr:O-antigen ligase family protein [Xanthocytophaga flavus]MDJ1480026.1 O-antigen ligase family protein [Xanthocytophaga flavus]